MVAAVLRARAEGLSLPGDVILAVVSDEEGGGANGAKYLVEEHAGLFAGVRYAIGEFGGFSLPIAGQRFYPIMVAEKLSCHVQATVRGPGGHGAFPLRGGAMARLGRLLRVLDERRLPLHVTPVGWVGEGRYRPSPPYRTGRETFTSSGSSVGRPLSLVPDNDPSVAVF